MTLCVDTILDHPTVDAMHVYPFPVNASSDHPNRYSDSTVAIRAYPYTNKAIHSPSGGSFWSRRSFSFLFTIAVSSGDAH